jgi:ribose transport system permease protein
MSRTHRHEPEVTPKKSEVQRLDRRSMLVQYAPFAVLGILIIVMTAANPSFLSRYNLQTIFDLTATLLVIALGQTFVIMLGSIDLSVGAIASLVSVVFAICIGKIGYWAYPAAIATGAVAGAINGIVFTKMKIPSFITTLGTLGLFQSIGYVLANGAPVQIKYGKLDMLEAINGSTLGISNLYVWAALILVVFIIVHRYTKLGRMISAVGNAERATWICGGDVSRVKFSAMMLSGLCAGISGIFLASQLFSGTPSLGAPYQLQSIASVAMGGTALTGGVGGPARTLVGVLVIAFLSNGMNVVGVNIYAQQIVTGFVVVAAVGLTLDRSKVPVIK